MRRNTLLWIQQGNLKRAGTQKVHAEAKDAEAKFREAGKHTLNRSSHMIL